MISFHALAVQWAYCCNFDFFGELNDGMISDCELEGVWEEVVITSFIVPKENHEKHVSG